MTDAVFARSPGSSQTGCREVAPTPSCTPSAGDFGGLGFNVRIAAMCLSRSRGPATLVIGMDRAPSALRLPLQYLGSDLFQPFDVGPLGAVTDVSPGLGLPDKFGEPHQELIELFP